MTASFIGDRGGVREEHEAGRLLDCLIARATGSPDGLLALLRAHQVSPAAVAGQVQRGAPEVHRSPAWRAAVKANREKGERLTRARGLTESLLAPLKPKTVLPPSSLGPLWSHDVDVLMEEGTLDAARAALRSAGFLDLEPLLGRLGRATPGVRRLAAVEGREVLAYVELCACERSVVERSCPLGGGRHELSPADRARRRCAKVAAARRPTARAALELLALAEDVRPLPQERDVAVAFRRCARLERELAGAATLSDLAEGLRPGPNLRWIGARTRGAARLARRRVRPRRLRVAFSGIDGAGKSTQASLLAEQLQRAGIPSGTLWTRMGYGGSRLRQRATRIGQRLLPSGSHSAMKARAAGAAPDVHATRRGLLGWSWALFVTVEYVWRARRKERGVRGAVIINDRSLPDALVGLDQGYGGALDLRAQRQVLRRLAPRPDVAFYMRLPGSVARERKEDMFAAAVLEGYAEVYDRLIAELGGVVTIDARRPRDEIASEVMATIAAAGEAPAFPARGLPGGDGRAHEARG